MPRDYSATESEAEEWIRKNAPKPTEDAPPFSHDQVRAFLKVIDDRKLPLFKDGSHGKSLGQPLFSWPSPGSSAKPTVLLPVFGVSHGKSLDPDKAAQKAAQMERMLKDPIGTLRALRSQEAEASQGQTWSQPPKSEFSSPSSSLVDRSLDASSDAAAAFREDGDQLVEVVPHSYTNPPKNDTRGSSLHKGKGKSKDDGLDDDPAAALAYMDTEFSKWTYAKREGIDAVTGAVMGAPPETHANLVRWDKKMWSKASSSQVQETNVDERELQGPGDTLTRATSDDPAQTATSRDKLHLGKKETAIHDDTAPVKNDSSSDESSPRKEQYASKRAALIAKDKAKQNSSVLTTQSATQKRAALRKNKNRKSIMPSPPHGAKQPRMEVESQAEPQQQQPPEDRPNTLIFANTDAGCRNAVNVAMNTGIIDPNNPADAESLFQVMKNFRELTKGTGDQT